MNALASRRVSQSGDAFDRKRRAFVGEERFPVGLRARGGLRRSWKCLEAWHCKVLDDLRAPSAQLTDRPFEKCNDFRISAVLESERLPENADPRALQAVLVEERCVSP